MASIYYHVHGDPSMPLARLLVRCIYAHPSDVSPFLEWEERCHYYTSVMQTFHEKEFQDTAFEYTIEGPLELAHDTLYYVDCDEGDRYFSLATRNVMNGDVVSPLR
eukprot:TRINITY_DN5727_c0_g1_i3.p1 TRINITY_DN5727_c0_g1~~TRINITY_DN5727_c0_g1_i3.p1  ORF type:complete len:106 (-),score=20.09 TRINITY_DN5727_c0_g1_i3:281-598(-)